MPIPAQFALGRRMPHTQSVGIFDFSEIGTSLADLTGNALSPEFFTGILDTAGKIGLDVTTKEIVSALGPDTSAGQVAKQASSAIVNGTTAVAKSTVVGPNSPVLTSAPTAAPTAAPSSNSTMLLAGLVAIILLTR